MLASSITQCWNDYSSCFTLCLYPEFDQFLEERVAAGEKLPERKPETDASGRSTAPAASRNGRQMPKDDSENALFAL